MQKKSKSKDLFKIIIVIVVTILLIIGYTYIFDKQNMINKFSKQIVSVFDENKNSKFSINQILLYSSANAKDNSENNDLQNMSISQYTDIAIYIRNNDNSSELTEENTINKLYIDNIKIETNQQNPDFKFGYKNSKMFGKYADIESINFSEEDDTESNTKKASDSIEFNVIHSKSESTTDFANAEFFTDCSNPITLGFVNSDIVKNFKVNEENRKLSFNGSILKDANVDLKKITPKISFEIHIVNNLNEEYFCKVFLDIPLENEQGSITSGYIILLNNYSAEYSFIKKK